MTDIEYLIIFFLIYAWLDVIYSCVQNRRINNLEDELQKIKKRNVR